MIYDIGAKATTLVVTIAIQGGVHVIKANTPSRKNHVDMWIKSAQVVVNA